MKKQTMKSAWEIARDGQNKFGGSVKSYFPESLKIAWKQAKTGEKNMAEITVENLIKAGGNEWKSDAGHHRIYFNNNAERVGLSCSFYKTGNVSTAIYCGEKISNSKAGKILSELSFVKVWFDVNENEFKSKNGDGYANDIINSIKEQIAAM
ncbi:MAG: hypothetical protein P8X74_03700 [Reinekea sp.]